MITIVAGDAMGGFQPEPGAVEAARYDPLSAEERRRVDDLEQRIRARVPAGGSLQPGAVDSVLGRGALAAAGVDLQTIDALRALRAPGLPYAVWVVPSRT